MRLAAALHEISIHVRDGQTRGLKMMSYCDFEKLIVIVDDQFYITELIRDALENAGFVNVLCFSNPTNALEMVRNGVIPEVVVSDYNMPEMTGFELLSSIKKLNTGIQEALISGDDFCSLRGKVHDCVVLSKQNPMFYAEIIDTVRALIQ
jgi:DNA-binding NtrC family response regulator